MYSEELIDILTKELIDELEKRNFKVSPKKEKELREFGIPYLASYITVKIKENADFIIDCEEALNEQVLDL